MEFKQKVSVWTVGGGQIAAVGPMGLVGIVRKRLKQLVQLGILLWRSRPIVWSTPPTLERSGPRKRTRTQERRKPGEGAEPGENFSMTILTLTLIVEVLRH